MHTAKTQYSIFFFFSSRRRHTRCSRDWSSDVCSSDLYAAGKKAVEGKDWKSAVERLNKALLQDDRNPDIHNLLGYAYRNAGQLDPAFRHYRRALELNPRHRGAREYLGEAYLLANEVQKAQEQLAALREICLIPCEEYEDLEKAITAYSKRAARSR